jgi:hypothetical protein
MTDKPPAEKAAAPCYAAVLATLDRLSRQVDDRRANEECMRYAPAVQSGPLTPTVAEECGLTIPKARYQLTRLWKAGLIERHKGYVGCIFRWYVKHNDLDQGTARPGH